MKISAIRSLIKEAISDMELSLELSNGKIIHGLARKDPKALSLQIGNNTYFYFWEGKFILSGTGDVTIVRGVDDRSQEWFLKATEEYLVAMHDAYPEKFGPLKEGIFDMFKSKPKPAPKPLSDFQKEIAKKYFEDRNKKLPISWTSSDGTVYSGDLTDIHPFEIDKSTGDIIPKVDATVKIMSSSIKGISIPLSVMTKDNTTMENTA